MIVKYIVEIVQKRTATAYSGMSLFVEVPNTGQSLMDVRVQSQEVVKAHPYYMPGSWLGVSQVIEVTEAMQREWDARSTNAGAASGARAGSELSLS